MPDIRAIARKAYKGTDVFALRQLFEEESRWQRKATIARNKLATVRSRINKLAEKLALEKVGIQESNS